MSTIILVYNNQEIHLDLQFFRISEPSIMRNSFDEQFTIADRVCGFGDDIELKGRIYEIKEIKEGKKMAFNIPIRGNLEIDEFKQSKLRERFKSFKKDDNLIKSLKNDNKKLLVKNKALENENNKLKKQLEELQADYDKNILKKVKPASCRFKALEMGN
jgi:hypothetical protein